MVGIRVRVLGFELRFSLGLLGLAEINWKCGWTTVWLGYPHVVWLAIWSNPKLAIAIAKASWDHRANASDPWAWPMGPARGPGPWTRPLALPPLGAHVHAGLGIACHSLGITTPWGFAACPWDFLYPAALYSSSFAFRPSPGPGNPFGGPGPGGSTIQNAPPLIYRSGRLIPQQWTHWAGGPIP